MYFELKSKGWCNGVIYEAWMAADVPDEVPLVWVGGMHYLVQGGLPIPIEMNDYILKDDHRYLVYLEDDFKELFKEV